MPVRERAHAPRTLDGMLLEGLAARFGDRTVQHCADGDLDVATLTHRSGTVAERLRACGVGRGTTVAVKGRRDGWLLPVLLGVLRTGGAYAVIPFNTPDPVERRMLDVLRPAAAVAWRVDPPAATAGRAGQAVAEGVDVPVVTALDGAAPAAGGPRHELDPAYVLATSGTSGTPKFVVVGHRAVAAFLDAAPAVIDLAPRDVVAARSSAAFDLSVWEIYAALLAGASSVLIPEDVAADPARLHDRLRGSRATVLSTTPSAAYQLAAHDASVGGGLHLRRLLVGGEAADGRRLADAMAAPSLAGCRLDNWYGPTEATVSCTGGPLDEADLRRPDVSIGPALPGVTVEISGTGELYVGGDQLAHGYLGDARATAAAFVPDPDGDGRRSYRTGDLVEVDDRGRLTCLGRTDSQVQLRGYRLELGEVERAVLADRRVRWCHAALSGTDSDVLIAYFATRGDEPVDRSAVWVELYGRLPRHAVPAALVQLTEVPVSEGEKLDTARLPAPRTSDFATDGAETVAPRTGTETRMHGLWRRLLGLDDIGIDHHFFALGGHSLLAARLINGISREFGVRPALHEVMDRLTVRRLSEWVDQRLDGTSPSVTGANRTGGTT
ncbi:non-ribosomal peptide synthetase [Pseudonocardia sp. HH130630-07]|uniref:non-ribosomal peptide synthetase n=1 Tax=Pseudonocardia sp. HH130630-07 TaxID=1690815 RepID=UPI0012E9A2BA|nr:non-ribosomal peptide synthetase [Pseudonocardia sp. HH130630-07]